MGSEARDRTGGEDENGTEDLTRFLERYAISCEVRSMWSVLPDHTVRQVGYFVDLYGSDDSPLTPDDERCREIVSKLSEIARRSLPPDGGDCRISIEGFPLARALP